MRKFRNKLTSVCLPLLCLAVWGIAARSASAATVTYTMIIDSAGPGTWEVRADASQGDNWGLALVSVPLVNVNFPVSLELPWIQYLDGGVKEEGMNQFPVDNASPIGATQDLSNVPLLVYGLGQSAGVLSSTGTFADSSTGADNVAYDASLLIATGTYNTEGAAPGFGGGSASANVFPGQGGENPIFAAVEFNTVVVPEPGALLLCAIGFLSMMIARRRRRHD